MAGNYKRSRIGIFGFTPEVTAGTSNTKLAVAASSGGTNATFDSGSASEENAALAGMAAANFFDGLEVYWASTTVSALAGTIQTITAGTYSGTTLTLTLSPAAAGTITAADTCYIVGRLPASNVSFDVGIENLPREEFVRNTLDRPSSLRGLPVVSGSFDMEVPARETALDDSVSAYSYDRFSQLFKGIGTINAPAGGDDVASATSASKFTPSTPASWAVNQFVLINSEVTKIVSIDGANEWTVYPALSATPSASDKIDGAECFVPDDTGHQSFTFSYLIDDQLYHFKGCVYSMSITGDYSQPLSASISFTGSNYSVAASTTFNFNNSAKATLPFVSGKAVITLTTSPFTDYPVYIGTFNFDFGCGMEVVRDTLNAQSAIITTREATLALSARNVDSVAPMKSQTLGIEALGIAFHGLIYVGTTKTAAVGVAGLIQPQDPSSLGDRTGIMYYDQTFNCIDNATDVSNSSKPLFFRF